MADIIEEITAFAMDRDEAFTAFVTRDDWDAVLRYLKKYCMEAPAGMKEEVMKVGVYKAVQEITDMPEEVKALAREKCIALGFKPYMQYRGGEAE